MVTYSTKDGVNILHLSRCTVAVRAKISCGQPYITEFEEPCNKPAVALVFLNKGGEENKVWVCEEHLKKYMD
jgi:hypothetical protein